MGPPRLRRPFFLADISEIAFEFMAIEIYCSRHSPTSPTTQSSSRRPAGRCGSFSTARLAAQGLPSPTTAPEYRKKRETMCADDSFAWTRAVARPEAASGSALRKRWRASTKANWFSTTTRRVSERSWSCHAERRVPHSPALDFALSLTHDAAHTRGIWRWRQW